MKTDKYNHKKHTLIPDFLIIGAGKCGTTSLDNYLRQHPEIFIPPKKEPNFYGYELCKPEELAGPDEVRHYRQSVTDLQDYLQLFQGAKENQLKGETSNTYMYHQDAPERIKYYNPEMKLIAVLRQPADRLWSRFLHLSRDQRLPSARFEDCLDRKTIWWRRNDLIREGFYHRNLTRFYELFPSKNIRVYLYEDFNRDSLQVLQDIFRFLEIDPGFTPNLSVRYNQSGIIKNSRLNQIIGTNGIIQRSARQILGSRYQKFRNNLVLQNVVNWMRARNMERPHADKRIRKTLTEEVYGQDIRQLQRLVQRDLGHWLRV